jgi:hypothetical protein
LGDKINKNEMSWLCSIYMGERRDAYRVLVRKSEGMKPLGRPRHRWVFNIKMDLQEVGWGAYSGLIWLRRGTGGGHL